MVVAGAADVVVQQWRVVRGLRRRRSVESVFEDRGDARVGQRADLDGPQADPLGPGGINAAKQAEHAEAGTKPLFWVRPAGQHGDDQRLGVRSDATCLALHAFWRPFESMTICGASG